MSRVVTSVLLPTDDSPGAIAGATWGIALAARLGAEIHALSVVETRGNSAIDATVVDALESRATAAVEAIEARAGGVDLDVTTAVAHGTPFQAIREYAYRHEVDIIVMGTKGRTGLERVLLGSVTENVLRTARCPVIAVPEELDDVTIDDVAFDALLLPTDGSEGAAIAAEWGIALADALGSTVHAVYSVDTSPFGGEATTDELFDRLTERGESAIETVREHANAAEVSVAGSIASGPASDVILTYATEQAVDLIVMGTHGQTGVGQWFLGSVTENVVRQADIPVVCVPVSADSPGGP